MPGFDEDSANSQVNTSILEQEFDLDTTEERREQIQEIRDMRLSLSHATTATDDNDPDTILLTNISRANTLLDTAQNSICNGGETNARLFEVCAQLINAITSAATSVQNSSFGLMKHEYNMKTIEIKEKEVAVKAAIAQDKSNKKGNLGVNGGVVVMSREELLTMIEQDDKEVHVESVGEEKIEQEN